MKEFANSRKELFLGSIPRASIDAPSDRLANRCKFNFSYFDMQSAGQDFGDWNHKQLASMLDKLKAYSREELEHWRHMPVGRGNGTVLVTYGEFPKNSDFSHPKHVPHQAQWGRFRLDWAGRLVGFTVPLAYDGKPHEACKHRFDCNTFYVVFLDINHRFYKTEKK